MSLLYTKTKPSKTTTGFKDNSLNKNLAKELQPIGKYVGGINVIKDFPWTLTPTTSRARAAAPKIKLKEFYQLDTNLNQAFKPYGRSDITQNLQSITNLARIGLTGNSFLTDLAALGQSAGQAFGGAIDLATTLLQIDANTNLLYEGLFDHLNETGFSYEFPFFTSEYFKINTQWSSVDILDKIIELQIKTQSFTLKGIGAAAKIFGGGRKGKSSEGGGTLINQLNQLPQTIRDIEMFNLQSQNPTVGLMDPPKIWKTTTPRSYNFQFALFNIDVSNAKDNKELIAKNWELCYLLTYQNLVNKRNFYTGIPPVFYEVMIPGVHYCKASYMSNLSISNLGNIRKFRLDLNGTGNLEVNVPDAYLLNITLTDLLVPSKNLLTGVIDTSLARTISESNSLNTPE